ncbi:MAG: heavy metal translocating P-type ATPase [Chroococcidiopsidaceae cyanobacterium CP_BM_ER_R8_30]|nr:heavy metal translocating P-type ATPase [Chroococcidiopsidaceae cyanobacterium CP_BM_ER_R8_30]
MTNRSLLTPHLTQLLKDNPELTAALTCGLLVLLGWSVLHTGWIGLSLLILCAAYVIGGYESAREGLTTLFREKQLDVDLLMIVAALGSASLGLWRREYYLIVDGALLILIFAFSGALESYAMQRTERGIRSLMSLTSDTARVFQHGQEQFIPIAQLQIGTQVIVKPGELIPTDGLITEGYSTLNEAPITGESMPVEKTVGSEVFAGTINGNGALRLKVHKSPESSLIQRVIQLVEQAQNEAPPSQQFIERFERSYAWVVVGVGLLIAFLPPFIWGWSWETTIYRALIFLVVASPCALMASIMPTLLSGITNGTRQGILFKNGAQLETIGRVRAIAFDKTGTLTTGQPQVVKTFAATGQSESLVLQMAAALEVFSEHPIGRAIAQAAQQQLQWDARTLNAGKPGTPVDSRASTAGGSPAVGDWRPRDPALVSGSSGNWFAEAIEVHAQPGQGIAGTIDGQQVLVGKAAFVSQQISSLPANLMNLSNALEDEGKTVVWVAQAGQVLGIIAVADTVRPAAASMVAQLKRLGLEQIVMLTGDNERAANSVAREIGVDKVYAELLPEDKLKVIRQLQQQYCTVAMVGDGINDAPALVQASVGIAMGAAGSDVALETADIVLMADRLEKLVYAIRLGRRSQVIVKQNIAFALSFIILLLIANFTGYINIPLGVIGHEGSTVLVTLSGLRLLRS